MPLTSLRPGDAVRIRGERWRVARCVPFDAAALVEVAGAAETNRGARATFVLPFEPLERLAVSEAPRTVRPAAWRAIARRALGLATPSPQALRAAARARVAIVPFQLEPALALVAGRGCRLLIGDEVGLGKTIQAGLIVAEVMAREPGARALVVCPAGLREQWQGELRDRFDLAATILDASGAARLTGTLGAGVNPWAAERLAIASVDYVKRPEVMRALEPLIWDVVVFDEAHALAGVSDRAAAASSLADRARRVVLLTATPHSGDEDGFRRMCDIGRLDGDAPLLVFRRGRAAAGLAMMRRSVTLRVRLSPPETAMHDALAAYARRVRQRAQLAMSVLLRRAWSSPASLARSIERRLDWLSGTAPPSSQLALPFFDAGALDDEEPSAVLAVAGLDDVAEEQRVLRRLLDAARRATAHESKLIALCRLLRRARQPALVFTEYRDTLDHLAARLPQATACLHGGMTPAARRAALRAFAEGSVDVLLATDAASEGLNLHARCRLVVNLELPWTPLRLEQRIGRVDRIGQSRRVHAVHLVGRGSGEEDLASRLGRRSAAAATSLERAATVDLRAEAEQEARRLLLARELLGDLPAEAGSHKTSRPALCTIRRRAGGGRRGRFRAWKLTFTDEDGRLVWESLLSLHADPCASADDETIDRVAREAEESQRAALIDRTRAAAIVLAAREEAIAQALRDRQARLAARLLQPGLFDRRAERAAAAQASSMRDALARSAARLQEIEAARHPHVQERRLVFALLVE